MSLYRAETNIRDWLDSYAIKNYKLVEDEDYGFVVNVDGDVKFQDNILFDIPIQFNVVTGNFIASHNKLTTLRGSPLEVHGLFNVRRNYLESLEYCPLSVGGFDAGMNKLTSLEFSPKIIKQKNIKGSIKGSFIIDNNDITSLKGCPEEIYGSFDCTLNKLTSLKFSPIKVGLAFECDQNFLTSLEFGPKIVNGSYACRSNQLNSLDYMPEVMNGFFDCIGNSELGILETVGDCGSLENIKKFIQIQKFKESLEDNIAHKPEKTLKIKI